MNIPHTLLYLYFFNGTFYQFVNCYPMEIQNLDNRYTEHSQVGLVQHSDQLDQLGIRMRMQHNLDQQIQARNRSGVSEDALREFSMMFKHFDIDKSGKLDHQEFKFCLRALGYDLPVVEDGQVVPEFQAILDMVDPNRDGFVSLPEYMAFMISRETENVQVSSELRMQLMHGLLKTTRVISSLPVWI